MKRLMVFAALGLIATACGNNSSGGASAAGGTGGGRPPYPTLGPNGELRGEGNFAALIQHFSQGQVARAPWAGYWWPYSQNGTASAEALYEQAHGPSGATRWELANHGSSLPGVQNWWGHCNGWAAAAVLYQEPRSATSANGVRFGVGDQKALLSELAMEVVADFFGTRNDDNDPSSLSFQDVFPDQFFLVLTNMVGNGMPVIIDRYTGNQVWNQPLAGYRIDPIQPSDYLGTHPSAPSIHRVMVTTTLWWLRDDVDGDHLTEPFSFSDGPSYESRTLRYEVWMDAPPVFDSAGKLTGSGTVVVTHYQNTVIGGAWRNGNDLALVNSYPDYMWVPHSVSPSTGFANPHVDLAWVEGAFGRRN